MKVPDRKGVTLIDVGVILTILIIAAALALPMMTQSRSDYRRSDCKNKLKQIGLALHNYEETHKTFPPGWIAVRGPDSGEQEQSAYGWGTYILPFLDNAPLYKKIQAERQPEDLGDPSFQAQAQRKPESYFATILPAYRCPASVGDSQDTTSSVPLMATTEFVGNFGVGVPTLEHPGSALQGIFGCNSKVRMRDIRDGTTNVVLLGERMQPRNGRAWRANELDGPFNSYWAGIPRDTSPLAIVATATTGDLSESGDDQTSVLNTQGNLNGVSGSPPKVRMILPNRLTTGDWVDLRGNSRANVGAGFSSYHRGGTSILLGDASVRFVNDTVDPTTYINLMRRKDGMTIGEF